MKLKSKEQPDGSVTLGQGTALSHNFSQDRVVCEDHFHPDCFQIDMKAKLLNYEPKSKKLVTGAIPTIFVHKMTK